MIDVARWLEQLGLAKYARQFAENAIGGDVLAELTDDDLKDLGIPLGDRKRLLKAIAAVARSNAVPAAATPGGTPEGERREVTVLFADLAGFSRLSADHDPEIVHSVLDRLFETVDGIVTTHGGAVDKHIGDCVMAVFGAPVAHGNDPERAARAALAIEAAIPRIGEPFGLPLGIHIGIANGEVVASKTGSAAHSAYTVTGEAVNLAARLVDQAKTGETLVSASVWSALGSRARGEPRGALTLEGFAAPVPAWRLTGLRDSSEALADRVFVGRSAELAQIDGALASCRTLGRGLTLLVRGDVGIGKTRLVEEMTRRAAAAGFSTHKGLVLDFGTGRGQDAIHALVRGFLGIDGLADEAARSEAAARAVAGGRLPPDARVHVNDLLDLPQPVELRALYDAMDDAAREAGRRATVAALVADQSAKTPRLLVVEDVHWSDAATRSYLASIAAAVADCPAVLVMTTRIEGDPIDPAWRTAAASAPVMTIDLAPLRAEEAAALASALIGAPSGLAATCVERSGGNPLFLEQLLRNAEETSGEAVPGSIRSIVLARMDRLSPHDRHALQAAAVLGQRATLDEIRAVLGDPGYSCDELVRRSLVHPEGEGFLFAHALIRDGVYASLLHARRRDLHQRAAAWFENRDPILRAQHLDRAGDPEAPAAYLAAASQEVARYHAEQARELAERGLAIATERADRFALTAVLGDLLLDLGQTQASLDAYEAARELTEDDAELCRANLGLAAAMRLADRLDDALAHLDAAQSAAERAGLDVERSRIHHLRGNIYFPKGDIAACVREHETAYALAQGAGSAEAEARALGGLGDAAYASGRLLTAQRHFTRCCELARANGLGRIEAANRPMAAVASLYALDSERAFAEARAAVDLAMRVGHFRAAIIGQHGISIACLQIGRLNECRAAVAEARSLTRRLGARRFEAENLMFLAEADIVEGDRARARRLIGEALEISRETGIGYLGPSILAVSALVAATAKDRQSALAEGEALLHAGTLSHNIFWFRTYAIDTALEARDWAEAERHAQALEDYTSDEPLPFVTFLVARARALGAYGRGARDETLRTEIERLVAWARQCGLRLGVDALERAAAAFGDRGTKAG